MRVDTATTISELWGNLLIEELVRQGVTTFCVAPGSRSTPITLGIAANSSVHAITHFDERGLGYLALGLAKALDAPVAIVTTSGTAAANLYPAVIEAYLDHIPLILLTADRPPEFIDCGANQAMDQIKLFGHYCVWHYSLPPASMEISPKIILTTAGQAAAQARKHKKPVHLNCAFREPFWKKSGSVSSDYCLPVHSWANQKNPYTFYPMEELDRTPITKSILTLLQKSKKILVIAGQCRNILESQAILSLCERNQWPLFPDILSHLRFSEHPLIISHYDLLLLRSVQKKFLPDCVLLLGTKITSKRLTQFLENMNCPVIQIKEGIHRENALHQERVIFSSGIVPFCKEVLSHGNFEIEAEWAKEWKKESAIIQNHSEGFLERSSNLSELHIGVLVSRILTIETVLFCGNSMPIRFLEMTAATGDRYVHTAANRGVSGIDGVLASAIGYVKGFKKNGVLVIGDLSSLHDLSSFLVLKNNPIPLLVIIINNNGGGIFHFLPISEHDDVFTPYFQTPHHVHFDGIAKMAGIPYFRVSTVVDWFKVMKNHPPYPSLIEVIIDQKENVKVYNDLEKFLISDDGQTRWSDPTYFHSTRETSLSHDLEPRSSDT